MKIKIKDFNGIYTNNDENDNRLEVCTESENFLHKRGFLEIDPRNLAEHDNLPLPQNNFPTNTATGAALTWVFETGVYATLSSDLLSTADNPTPGKHDLLVLIAKATEGSTFHRLVYLWDFTDNGPFWYEMSRYGNYTRVANVPIIDIENADESNSFANSTFTTDIDGDVHFQVEDGRLKLYFPHDTFWLGKIDRKIHAKDDKHRWPQTDDEGVVTYPWFDYEHDYWYIDRITDSWKHDNQRIRIWDQDNITQFPWFDAAGTSGIECALGTPSDGLTRRGGILYKLFVEEDPAHVVGGRDIIAGDVHNNLVYKETEWSNFRCVRSTLQSTDGLPVSNPFKTFSDPSIFAFWLDARRTTDAIIGEDEDPWPITDGQYSDIYITFLPYGNQSFRLRTGETDHESLDSYHLWDGSEGNKGQIWNVATKHDVPEAMWSISLTDFFENEWEYGGDLETGDIGWTETQDKFSIIVTAVLDDREEIPIAAHNWVVDPTTQYVLTISDITLPWNMNKRTTRIKFYHKLKDATDYEMVKDMDLLSEESSIETFDISTEVYDGFFLATQTGFLWNYYDHPADYKIISGWKDFVTESGISIGINTRDEVAVYHSTFGGGNLMPDLVYDDNRLPITGVSELTAVANADGRLMAFTPHTSYVITAQEIAGVIAFRFEDTVEVGVKNKNDIANIQGGVLVHTRHGIYITNGYETKSISEAIDDIVRENYSTGRVYYNRYEHEVYYKPTEAEDLYRFRMIDSVWEHTNKTVTPGEQSEEIGEIEAE